MAALAAKSERQRVIIKVGLSRCMRSASTLARGATVLAVLTLEMHSQRSCTGMPRGCAESSARRRLPVTAKTERWPSNFKGWNVEYYVCSTTLPFYYAHGQELPFWCNKSCADLTGLETFVCLCPWDWGLESLLASGT